MSDAGNTKKSRLRLEMLRAGDSQRKVMSVLLLIFAISRIVP